MSSRYVKLTKEKESLEDIAPGELNQPVQVPEVGISIVIEAGNSFFINCSSFFRSMYDNA